jgi:hypothetical protein
MAYVSTLETVPAAMIFRTTVAEEKSPPEVVIAPAGAVPSFITTALAICNC